MNLFERRGRGGVQKNLSVLKIEQISLSWFLIKLIFNYSQTLGSVVCLSDEHYSRRFRFVRIILWVSNLPQHSHPSSDSSLRAQVYLTPIARLLMSSWLVSARNALKTRDSLNSSSNVLSAESSSCSAFEWENNISKKTCRLNGGWCFLSWTSFFLQLFKVNLLLDMFISEFYKDDLVK